MQRYRNIAAAPVRSASVAWRALEELVTNTLSSSQRVDASELADALAAAAPVGRLLIAGGHLDANPVVLVASPIHLSISTVSGNEALNEDDSASVPGGAGVEDWTLHLPTPDPLDSAVRAAASRHHRLSAEPAPAEAEKESARAGIDREAIARRLREKQS